MRNYNLNPIIIIEDKMATTLPDIIVEDVWISLNDTAGIAIGDGMVIHNKSTTWVLLQESATQPSVNSTDGVFLTDLYHTEPSKIAQAGSLEIWAKSSIVGRKATISVQPL